MFGRDGLCFAQGELEHFLISRKLGGDSLLEFWSDDFERHAEQRQDLASAR
jgi:hypothetical protein